MVIWKGFPDGRKKGEVIVTIVIVILFRPVWSSRADSVGVEFILSFYSVFVASEVHLFEFDFI